MTRSANSPSHWTQSLPVMLAAVRGIDAEDRDVMADVLKGSPRQPRRR